MRKISEKDLKKRGVRLNPNDLGRIASSKSAKVISDVGKAMEETVKTLDKISLATKNNTAVNADIVKLMQQRQAGIRQVEIVGGDDKPKQWRVRVTARDRGGNISEIIMEQI